jgi:hypothetical protein
MDEHRRHGVSLIGSLFTTPAREHDRERDTIPIQFVCGGKKSLRY